MLVDFERSSSIKIQAEHEKFKIIDVHVDVSMIVSAQHLLRNDIETFRDVLISHLRTLSKTDLAKTTGLGRRTLYDLMDETKFDPRLSTLGALLNKITG